MKKILLSLVLLLAAVAASAADTTRSAVSALSLDLRPGYVFPTNPFFRGENTKATPIEGTGAVHLQYSFRFSRDSKYGRLYPHAYQGIGLAWNTFFNNSEMGTPVAVYAFQGSRIVSLSPRLSLDYEWNFGASFGWKKYDDYDNPWNVVVGSRANAYLNFGLLLNYRLDKRWNLVAGVDVAHYSNGNTSFPNAGVNTIGARLGAVYNFGRQPEFSGAGESISPHIVYDLILFGSLRKKGFWDETESFVDGTFHSDERYLVPGRFAVAGFNFNPIYRFNKYFGAGVSLDAKYDESANIGRYLVPGTLGDNPKFYRPPFDEQFAVGLSLRGELTMPIFSINIGIGHNVYYKGADWKGWYQIVALKTFVTRNLFLHVGYQLSDFKDPSYLMLGVGWRFNAR